MLGKMKATVSLLPLLYVCIESQLIASLM